MFLVNHLAHDDTRKPKDIKAPGDEVLKFIVDRDPSEPDNSRKLTASTFTRALPPIDLTKVKAKRVREFTRKNGVWTVNDQIFEVANVRANPQLGSAEIWVLRNGCGGWAHPILIHFEEGRILKRDGVTPPPQGRGCKDTCNLLPN